MRSTWPTNKTPPIMHEREVGNCCIQRTQSIKQKKKIISKYQHQLKYAQGLITLRWHQVKKNWWRYTAKTTDTFFCVLGKSWNFSIKTLTKTCDTTGKVAWEVGENMPWRYCLKFVFWRNQITRILIHSSKQNMWIVMWYAFPMLTLHVINQSMLKSKDKCRSNDRERPVNINSGSVSSC